MRSIYGIGETVYDIIFKDNQPQRAVPGGSCFNSLISLGRCGLHPTMATETGDDHVGRIIIDFMQKNGVSTDHVTVNPGTKSHVSLAFLDENNDAHYQFYKDHASASVEPHFPDFQPDDIVLFGSFFAVNPVIRPYTREFLQRAKAAGCIIYYDVNFRAAHIADLPNVMDNIVENMSLATIVRGSTEDFECLFGETDPDAVYRQHVAPHCRNFICTAGGAGVLTFFGDCRQSFAVAPIDTVSTIGAGDNFNAGVIYSIVRRHIRLADLTEPSAETVAAMVDAGQRFSAEVCQLFDNYVTPQFARRLLKQEVAAAKAMLFDLDGVIIDTEGQYQKFWGQIGREYLPEIPDFAERIKGSTLVAIHETYFPDATVREEVDRRLIDFEDTMTYEVFPGAAEFLSATGAEGGVPRAIVTSSNQMKMASLAQQQPTLTSLFDRVFTAEDAGRGKPFPDCFINAARQLGFAPEECVVFEDSINGLKAARASGAFVVGLTTTHSEDLVRQYADITIGSLDELLP